MSEPVNFTIEIDRAEVVALVKFHCARATRINKRLGQELLKMKASTPLWSTRAAKEMIEMAREIQLAEMGRSKVLAALLEKAK